MEEDTTARDKSPHPGSKLNEDSVNEEVNDNLNLNLDSETNTEAVVTEAIDVHSISETSVDEQNALEKETPSPNASPKSSSASLLNNAVIKHEKNCINAEDEYASTIAICNIFSTTPDMLDTHDHENSDDFNSNQETESTKDEILITDLDSLSCGIQIHQEKESLLEASGRIDNKTDMSHDGNQPMSPNIILLDLQSQDEYVTDFLNREVSDKEKMRENDSDFLNVEHMQQTSGECFSFEGEREIHEEDTIFHNQNNETYSEFIKEKKFHNSPIIFHDLNDYEPIISKSFERPENVEEECDAVFFVPASYSQNKEGERVSLNDKFSCTSPKHSLNVSNSDTDYNGQSYEFSINDSGFFDISSEKSNLTNGTMPGFSFKMSNQNMGITKCNLNRQFFDGIHSDSVPSSGFKLSSPYMSPTESQLQITGGTSSPFCFASTPNTSMSTSLLYKQPVMDYGVSFQQSHPQYSDLLDSCSLSSCSDWNSWNNGGSQEITLNAIPQSHFVSPHLQQSKYIWHGEPIKKMETNDPYTEYLKPAVNDNDSEETEDADEFDDVPIYFNTSSNFLNGYDRQWPQHSASYYGDGTSGSQFGLDSLTSPSSASNTPSDNSSLHSPLPLSSVYCKPSVDKVETNFLTYDRAHIPKLPFPSMADMMRSSRSASSKSSRMTSKHGFADNASHGSRFRKNQIQSDAISTSTSRGTRYKKKWATELKKSDQDNVSDIYINLDGLEEVEQNRGPRRHNEPLKQNAIGIMSQWYEDHLDNPYPTKVDKLKMAKEGGITVTQVKSWFANKRNRTNNTKPKVQKRVMEEKLKELFKDITCNRSLPLADNSHIINQLSGIIQTCHASTKME